MKKAFIIFSVLVFGLFVLVISIISQTNPTTSRQSTEKNLIISQVATNSAETIASSSASQQNYLLPYPGILPDHPLYGLKMIRDRILLVSTNNKEQKIRLLILYADKRVASAMDLAQKNQFQLAQSTVTKSEKYLEEALITLQQIGSDGQKDLWQSLYDSSVTHQQIIREIISFAPDNLKSLFESSLTITNSVVDSSAKQLI
jgi:hypothetical protein